MFQRRDRQEAFPRIRAVVANRNEALPNGRVSDSRFFGLYRSNVGRVPDPDVHRDGSDGVREYACPRKGDGAQELAVAVDDAASFEVVGGKLDQHCIPRVDADEVAAHLAGNRSEYLVLLLAHRTLHQKHGVGQRLKHQGLYFNSLGFGYRNLTDIQQPDRSRLVLPSAMNPGIYSASGQQGPISISMFPEKNTSPSHSKRFALRRPSG